MVQSVSITTAWLWTTGSVVTKMPMGKKGGVFSFEELTCPDVSQKWLTKSERWKEDIVTYATSQKHEDKPVVTAVDWSTDLSAGVRLLLAAASQLALAPFPELKESQMPFPLREPGLHPLCPVWGEKTRS